MVTTTPQPIELAFYSQSQSLTDIQNLYTKIFEIASILKEKYFKN